ncbi:hypothetical protein LZ30DRAFT_790216, partial [Colletotrichum cereale]
CQTLFVLDGLDEVSELLDPDHSAFGFLVGLLNRSNVILTTRPHTRLPSDVKTPDLELDTYGFHPDQVQKYLEAVLPKDAEKIQSFLQKNRLLQSLVRIPIQLDALCLTWNENSNAKPIPTTMTAVYQVIVERLWKKDIKRLKKEFVHTEALSSSEVEDQAGDSVKVLECMAFSGLHSSIIEFDSTHRDALYDHSRPLQIELPLNEMFGSLSFMRTSDPSADPSTRSYHFLHLSFQEYFAAKYFARKWKENQNLQYLEFNRRRNNCREITCDALFNNTSIPHVTTSSGALFPDC